MNTVGPTVLQSFLLTILRVGFVYAGSVPKDGETPKAIVVPPESIELEQGKEKKALPKSVVQELIENQSVKLMTKEELDKATLGHERDQGLLAGLTIVLGIAVLFMRRKLFGHWIHAVETPFLGLLFPLQIEFAFPAHSQFASFWVGNPVYP
jgi:hypothetical protein